MSKGQSDQKKQEGETERKEQRTDKEMNEEETKRVKDRHGEGGNETEGGGGRTKTQTDFERDTKGVGETEISKAVTDPHDQDEKER